MYNFIVPYSYVRSPYKFTRHSLMYKRHDNNLNKIKRRIIHIDHWHKQSFNKRRFNIFKNNYQIKLNFINCSYKNKWY